MDAKDVFILETIVEYCDRILKAISDCGNDFESFDNSLDHQDSCSFRLIQIGEEINSLSDIFKDAHPEIPWRDIVGTRNLLTHEYGKASTAKIWDTLTNDIEPLRSFCAEQIGLK